MLTPNIYRFLIVVGVYLGIAQLAGRYWVLPMLEAGRVEVVEVSVVVYLLIYGAVTYAILNGKTAIRLILVAFLPVFAYLVNVVLYGLPYAVGTLLLEAVGLLIGAVLMVAALRVFRTDRPPRQ